MNLSFFKSTPSLISYCAAAAVPLPAPGRDARSAAAATAAAPLAPLAPLLLAALSFGEPALGLKPMRLSVVVLLSME